MKHAAAAILLILGVFAIAHQFGYTPYLSRVYLEMRAH